MQITASTGTYFAVLRMVQKREGETDLIDVLLAGVDVSDIEGDYSDIIRDVTRARINASEPLLLLANSLEKLLPPLYSRDCGRRLSMDWLEGPGISRPRVSDVPHDSPLWLRPRSVCSSPETGRIRPLYRTVSSCQLQS
jgi:hypothetical protein